MVTARLIIGRFVLDEVMCQGGQGLIVRAWDTKTGRAVVLKAIPHEYAQSADAERACYEAFKARPSFIFYPLGIIAEGKTEMYTILAFPLLGPSLHDIAVSNPLFDYATLNPMAIELLYHLEYIHDAGFVHCDLKPANILTRSKERRHRVYIIDFGSSQRYVHNGVRLPEVSLGPPVGTHHFSSIRSQGGLQQSPRDDLESLAYVLIHMGMGDLPWIGLEDSTEIQQAKEHTPEHELCGHLDAVLYLLLYAKELSFAERPDYDHLRRKFRRTP